MQATDCEGSAALTSMANVGSYNINLGARRFRPFASSPYVRELTMDKNADLPIIALKPLEGNSPPSLNAVQQFLPPRMRAAAPAVIVA